MAAPAHHCWSWSRLGLALTLLVTLCAVCHGSHGSRGRGGGQAVLRPVVLLETEQGLGLGPAAAAAAAADDMALMELDQLLNLFQAKGKRSQDQADKGLTRDLVQQVLQPGGAGMWFGPRLGRRRRSVPTSDRASDSSPSAGQRRKRSIQDSDVDDDIPWKLAEILKELQGPKRSPAPCDQTDINCLLASIASSSNVFAPEQQQHPRSEGNLVNFTPRLGRNSGEQADQADNLAAYAEAGDEVRQLRTDNEPLWFSPRLGRRLLPLGALDVHGPANAPPPPQPSPSARQQPQPQARGMRAARSAENPAQNKSDRAEQANQERAQA